MENGSSFSHNNCDDPDGQSLEVSRIVSTVLADLGSAHHRGVAAGSPRASESRAEKLAPSATDLEHGAEVSGARFSRSAWHNATLHHLHAARNGRRLDRVSRVLRGRPSVDGQTITTVRRSIGDRSDLTGIRRTVYNLLTVLPSSAFDTSATVEGHPYFWGDICRDRDSRYCRQFHLF